MLESDYRRAMDALGPDKSLADRVLERARGARTAPRPRRHLGRRLVLAGAACLLLTASALALSPSLRQALEGALGGYADYAQPAEGAVTANGIEIRVVSALADNSMIKVYAQARDLEGERLNGTMDVMGVVSPQTLSPDLGISSSIFHTECLGYDPETKTALLEFTTWGLLPGEDEILELTVLPFQVGDELLGGAEGWHIPFTAEKQPVRTVWLDGHTLNGTPLLRAELSVLGTAVYAQRDLGGSKLGIYLKDGSVRYPAYEGGGSINGVEGPCCAYWDFDDPVDPETVIGLSLDYWYIPLEGDAAGAGHWLPQ